MKASHNSKPSTRNDAFNTKLFIEQLPMMCHQISAGASNIRDDFLLELINKVVAVDVTLLVTQNCKIKCIEADTKMDRIILH